MSPLAVPLATFVFFLGLAAAQTDAPSCNPSFEWTANSLGQNPCMVAAYLMAVCSGGSFTIPPLGPGYPYYTGPTGAYDSDLCECNTVTYSLISACGACQGAQWISWPEYSANCVKTLPPSEFPHPIPSGTRVPQWALIDITPGGIWNMSDASAVGDNPEPAPGVRLGTPKSSPNKDAIIGGAAGGAVTIVLVITICFFLRWRRRKVSTPVPQPVVDASESQPSMNKIRPVSTMNKILQLVTNLKKMDDGIDGHTMSSITGPIQKPSVPSLSEQPLAPMWNDPNYPPTFPGYQGLPQTPSMPFQGSVPSLDGAGNVNSLATLQTSGQQGLPTV